MCPADPASSQSSASLSAGVSRGKVQSTVDILKGLVEDFIRERWGDLCALFLIVFGSYMVWHGPSEIVSDLGKTLVGSGLISLRLKGMPAGTNGNGHPPDAPAAT